MQQLRTDNGADGRGPQSGPDELAPRNGRTILCVPKGPEQVFMLHTSLAVKKGRGT